MFKILLRLQLPSGCCPRSSSFVSSFSISACQSSSFCPAIENGFVSSPVRISEMCFFCLDSFNRGVHVLSVNVFSNTPSPSSFRLCFETKPGTQPFIWKCVLLASSFFMQIKPFSFEWFRARTLAETEAKGNSEMAYQLADCEQQQTHFTY